MKTNSKLIINTFVVSVALLLLSIDVNTARAQNFYGSDSLIGTTENTTDWKSPDSGVQGGSAFTNTESGLQYTDSTNTDDNIDRGWQLNHGSYTQNWTLQLQVNLGGISLSDNSQRVDIGMQIGETGNFSNNSMELNLGETYGSSDDFNFVNYVTTGGVNSVAGTSPQVDSISGGLQIDYDASTQTISTYYNTTGTWTFLASTSIASGATNWDMTSANSFTVAIQGYSDDTIVSSGEAVYAADFVATPEPSTCAMLAVGAASLIAFRRRPRP